MQHGKRTVPAEPLSVIRARAKQELAALPPSFHVLEAPPRSWVGIAPEVSPRLLSLVEEVRAKVATLG
jgi:nicotinate phosphoribosyltransferase